MPTCPHKYPVYYLSHGRSLWESNNGGRTSATLARPLHPQPTSLGIFNGMVDEQGEWGAVNDGLQARATLNRPFTVQWGTIRVCVLEVGGRYAWTGAPVVSL